MKRCEDHHVDAATALRTITSQPDIEPFEHLFRRELEIAGMAAKKCPVRLAGPGNLDLVYHLSEHVGATRAIETGVGAGWSSLAFLLSLRDRPGAMLASTDMPYPGSPRILEQYVGCVVPDELGAMWRRFDAPDRASLPQALGLLPEIDICHYDSDKSYDGRMWAYPLLWEALRPGGVFISDDIDDNLAFFDFSQDVGRDPAVVKTRSSTGHKYVGVLIR